VARTIFQRHGAKTVFVARFIFVFPPIAANLLAGMSKMQWRTFLFYNVTGSAAYTTTYILIGYFFGKKWKLLVAWLGPTALYLIFAGLVIVVLAVIFRNSVSGYWARLFPQKPSAKISARAEPPFYLLASEEMPGWEFSENIRVLNP